MCSRVKAAARTMHAIARSFLHNRACRRARFVVPVQTVRLTLARGDPLNLCRPAGARGSRVAAAHLHPLAFPAQAPMALTESGCAKEDRCSTALSRNRNLETRNSKPTLLKWLLSAAATPPPLYCLSTTSVPTLIDVEETVSSF